MVLEYEYSTRSTAGDPAVKCNNAPIVPACGVCSKFHTPPDKGCWRPPQQHASLPAPKKPALGGGGAGKGGR